MASLTQHIMRLFGVADAGLYVARRVVNDGALADWWQAQTGMAVDEDLHCTVIHSETSLTTPVAASLAPLTTNVARIGLLGDKDAVVLFLADDDGTLQARWQAYQDAGATDSHGAYQPHVTLCYGACDLSTITLPDFPIVLGPEICGTLEDDIFHSEDAPMGDGNFQLTVKFAKTNEEQQMVYGWASVTSMDGQPVTDLQQDVIHIDELRKAAHEFMLSSRDGGEMHVAKGKGAIVESIIFDKAQQDALGIDLGQEGWYIGYKVLDAKVWKAVKSGQYRMFSIGGVGQREEMTKYNHSHDAGGRFSGGGGGGGGGGGADHAAAHNHAMATADHAFDTGTSDAHRAAAAAHTAASSAHAAAGIHEQAQWHAERAAFHTHEAAFVDSQGSAAAAHAARLTQQANDAGNGAHFAPKEQAARAHQLAAAAHHMASKAHEQAGNPSDARYHAHESARHTMGAAKATARDASRLAAQIDNPERHKAAANAHHTAHLTAMSQGDHIAAAQHAAEEMHHLARARGHR